MFELKTLTDYSDESLFAELRRVASALHGQRMTVEKFNDLSRVHSSTLQKRFGSFTNAVARAGIVQDIAPHLKQITREEVIEAIQAYAAEFSGKSPTVEEIAKRLEVDRSTILHKFGKWTDLLSSVGIKPVPLGRRYSDEKCFENIVALWTHYGRQPHFGELNQSPSTIGSKAYVLRWGGWRAALAAFVDYVNQQPQDSVDSQVEPPQKPENQGAAFRIGDVEDAASFSNRQRLALHRLERCLSAPIRDRENIKGYGHSLSVIGTSRNSIFALLSAMLFNIERRPHHRVRLWPYAVTYRALRRK